MWSRVVCVLSFAFAAAGQEIPQTLDDYDTESFPYEGPPDGMKKITGRSIFITPTVVRCPDRYHYNPFYDRCVKRIRLARTEGQLLHQLNTMYGSRQNDKMPPGPLSSQRLNMKDKLSAMYRNFTLTHPELKIRHMAHRRANAKMN